LWWSPDNVVAYMPITDLIPVSTTSGRILSGVTAITGWQTMGGLPAWFKVYGENLGLGVNGWTIGFLNPTTDPAATSPVLPAILTGWDSTVGQVLMNPVPEPSAIALAGLGISALLLFRWLGFTATLRFPGPPCVILRTAQAIVRAWTRAVAGW
jgi:hypothetical protein